MGTNSILNFSEYLQERKLAGPKYCLVLGTILVNLLPQRCRVRNLERFCFGMFLVDGQRSDWSRVETWAGLRLTR